MPYCRILLKDTPLTKVSNFPANFPNNVIISAERNKNKGSEHLKQQNIDSRWSCITVRKQKVKKKKSLHERD